MGNALEFLNKSKDKAHRGHHNTVCKEKQEVFIKKNGTTQCEEYLLIQSGRHSTGRKVNDVMKFTGSIDKFNARMFKKRDPINCAICNNIFIPRKTMRNAKVKKALGTDSDYAIWCPSCTQKGANWRHVVKRVGIVQFNLLSSKLLHITEITQDKKIRRNLYIIEEQISIRRKIQYKPAIKSLCKYRDEIIDEAYRINAKLETHFAFDF